MMDNPFLRDESLLKPVRATVEDATLEDFHQMVYELAHELHIPKQTTTKLLIAEIKKKVYQYQDDSIAYSWAKNPDRMGR